MTLKDLGYNDKLEKYRNDHGFDSFDVARVILEHKERYVVSNSKGEFASELVGNLMFAAENRSDFPAVGDWVAISEYHHGKALIHAIYPRNTCLERKTVGQQGDVQIIACNVDYGIIVQAVDNNFNLNRIERYLTICHATQIKPIIVLTKIDLINLAKLNQILEKISERINNVQTVAISNETQAGYDKINGLIVKGKTYCLLGSSGVGKSTLLNNLSSRKIMKTGAINTSVNKGKHTTSHRELVVLDQGGIFIDNPGMREVGITDMSLGLETTFDTIMQLSKKCKFHDCTHTNENGCAVIESIALGNLKSDEYNNYLKMLKEKEHFESSIFEKRKKDKDLGKIIKHFQKGRKKNKF